MPDTYTAEDYSRIRAHRAEVLTQLLFYPLRDSVFLTHSDLNEPNVDFWAYRADNEELLFGIVVRSYETAQLDRTTATGLSEEARRARSKFGQPILAAAVNAITEDKYGAWFADKPDVTSDYKSLSVKSLKAALAAYFALSI